MLLCLNELVPQVVDGGVVILDDYYTWDGCPRAVHEYLASRDLPYKIRRYGRRSLSYRTPLGASTVKTGHRCEALAGAQEGAPLLRI